MKYDEQYALAPLKSKRALHEALFCSMSFAAFAFIISFPLPVKTVAFIPLLMAAFIISRHIYDPLSLHKIIVRDFFSKRLLAWNLIGIQIAIAGALYYRGSYGMPVLPLIFRNFVFVAVIIGVTEELVFRGFIQGLLSKLYPIWAVFFAAFAQASYKACLFLSPVAQPHFHLLHFFLWSFSAFITLGLLKYFSKSIVPAIIVHALFDLLVYAENMQAPWWVW